MRAGEHLRYLVLAAQREGNRMFAAALRPLNLTPAWAEALSVLDKREPLTIRELGLLLVCEGEHPSRLVNRMVIAGLLSVAAAGGVPWWFALVTLSRELIVSILTVVLAALGAARIDVLWWGKVSTFALMTTFPLFLLTTNPHHGALVGWQHVVRDGCWVIGLLGLTLSWIVLFGYVRPALDALRAGRQGRRIL